MSFVWRHHTDGLASTLTSKSTSSSTTTTESLVEEASCDMILQSGFLQDTSSNGITLGGIPAKTPGDSLPWEHREDVKAHDGIGDKLIVE